MGEANLKYKLEGLLRKLPFTEECQVVYFFVEIRKLLDRMNRSEDYEYIRFFCDWVLHTEKTRNLDIIRDDIDKIAIYSESQAKKSVVQLIMDADVHPYAEFVDFKRLRTELEEFLINSEITMDLLKDDKNWFSLRNLLFRILSDQPIDFCDKPVRGIKSINFVELREGIYGCGLIIESIENGVLAKRSYIFADDEPNFKVAR